MNVLEGSCLCRGIGLVDYSSFVLGLAIKCQVVNLLNLHQVEVLLQLGVVEHAHVVWSVRVV